MKPRETAITFDCKGAELLGIVHSPETQRRIGVLIVVGGPQYRIGSHRQYLLLARKLAMAGFAAMRFDYRGTGDSGGNYPGFEAVGPDIDVAIEAFMGVCPWLDGVAVWGLCEGASTALMHGAKNPRIKGIVAANPWVRTQTGKARTLLRHYYLSRLFNAAFWRNFFSGRVNVLRSVRALLGNAKSALGLVPENERARVADPAGKTGTRPAIGKTLPERMAIGLQEFSGPVLFLLSGKDLTANEFRQAVTSSEKWQALMQVERVSENWIDGADHTFSDHGRHEVMVRATCGWMEKIEMNL